MENKFTSLGISIIEGKEEYRPKFEYPTQEQLEEYLKDKYFYKRDLDEFGCFKGNYVLNVEDIQNIFDNYLKH